MTAAFQEAIEVGCSVVSPIISLPSALGNSLREVFLSSSFAFDICTRGEQDSDRLLICESIDLGLEIVGTSLDIAGAVLGGTVLGVTQAAASGFCFVNTILKEQMTAEARAQIGTAMCHVRYPECEDTRDECDYMNERWEALLLSTDSACVSLDNVFDSVGLCIHDWPRGCEIGRCCAEIAFINQVRNEYFQAREELEDHASLMRVAGCAFQEDEYHVSCNSLWQYIYLHF